MSPLSIALLRNIKTFLILPFNALLGILYGICVSLVFYLVNHSRILYHIQFKFCVGE
jgi:hypothetical protein